jgi:DNA polymerase-1
MSKRIALIDGYGFVFRAYHSLPPLTRPDGTPVGAVYGFTNMLVKLLASLEVSHVAVVFDSGSKTFRNDIYQEYKANRPPCPEDLKPQFPIVREVVESLNISVLEKVGFEADDIIATVAKSYKNFGFEVLIISSDKDLMQLIDDNISMYDAMKNKSIGEKEVLEKFFVKPSSLLDFFSLIGDSSDNVPGVNGIGPKTAAELINKFGNLDNIFSSIDQISQEKRKKMLLDGKENAYLSKKLITLKNDVELNLSIDDLQIRSIEPNKFLSFLQKQGFFSLLNRVKKEFELNELNSLDSIKNRSDEEQNISENFCFVEEKKFKEIKITEISDIEICDQIFLKIKDNGIVNIDYSIENSAINFLTISIGENFSEIFYCDPSIEKNSIIQENDLFSFNKSKENKKYINNFLQKILADESIKKRFFDAKSFLKFFPEIIHKNQLSSSFDDFSIISHLVNSLSNKHLQEMIELNVDEDIDKLGFRDIFLTYDKKQNKSTNKNNIPFIDNSQKISFFAFCNYSIAKLYQKNYHNISSSKLTFIYHKIELPLLFVLASIELNGVLVDHNILKSLSYEFGQEITRLTSEIYDLAGCEFNIASTKQLSDILFNKLSFSSTKKSKKTGNFSTSLEVLEELDFEGNKIAGKVLEFRKLSKLKSTYTDALPQEINQNTGRIHTTLSSISTSTGRLSSSNPNLQNIPIKTTNGRKIRKSFIAKKDHVLLSADYSQIELRVIAHVAKINSLIEAFKQNKDIHRITASQVFNIDEQEVSDELRNKAKAINFGIIYGISAFGLAKQIKVPRNEASNYMKSYFNSYPGIQEYMSEYINLAKHNGYVTTIYGRKCFIPNINNKNSIIRNESERLAINAPIQGSAADIIKMAMISLDKKLFEKKLKTKIILQIHDELLLEVPNDEIQIVEPLVKVAMENVVDLLTPLKIDIKVSLSW